MGQGAVADNLHTVAGDEQTMPAAPEVVTATGTPHSGSQVTPAARIPCSKRGYERASQPKETLMSFLDKFKNKRDSTVGKAKETHGSATGNKSLQNEGKADQSKADLKSAGENVKDAFKK